MLNTALRDAVLRVLPRVRTPAQYTGGELNSGWVGPRRYGVTAGSWVVCCGSA